ncbi:methyltransferase domain-containing protein [Paludifilum halophilum]|nr:methyltransferase domain-containing protein [Paludifilum halophilum]
MHHPYLATVLPGLENVLIDEMKVKIPEARVQLTERGKVYFKSCLPLASHLQLRTADHLYRFIDRFSVGPHKRHLPKLEKQISEYDLSFAESVGGPDRSYVVHASRRGKHTYSRFEAAEAAMRGIARRYPGWIRGNADHHTLAFRLDLQGEDAVFSLRLTDASFRFRGRRSFTPAALRPTIAHALVWCSSPQETDTFVDPCCGSGTILQERMVYPFSEIRGGDLSEKAIQSARANLKDDHVVQRWNAGQLPLDSGYVDQFVSNLPFGRQIGNRADLGDRYREWVREMSRVLKPGGNAILLTEEGDLLSRAADQCSLHCRERMRLRLKGLRPAIYQLQK